MVPANFDACKEHGHDVGDEDEGGGGTNGAIRTLRWRLALSFPIPLPSLPLLDMALFIHFL